ncbi:hypothetical protein [Massilia sp. DWR3-1-1]|uniref:hypothetical protein n=1 Tax=Massilia sp. DWR3-1-1 TaxID=2804559 RepID=UPI003CF8A9AA
MAALMKEMKDASADRTPGAKERVELLQVRIQACQMQIEQVQAAAAQKAQLKQAAQSPAADGGAPARAADGAIGRNIDVMA